MGDAPAAQHAGHPLPEERRLRHVLNGSLAVGALFMAAFVTLTLIKAVRSPNDVTANWFAAWGTWAGGFATAAAFLIAAFSIAVASAHARVDRHVAATIRADDEMAQARLLAIYKVDIPGAFQGLATFRIENRSQHFVFDVRVPFADTPSDTGAPPVRRTPDKVESEGLLHEYLPRGETLTPYMQSTSHEGWFTEMTLHTRQWQHVSFVVEYTDGSGLRWRQHFGGGIERVLTDQAPRVKPADRFQSGYQITPITDDKARRLGGRFAAHLPPLESDEDFLEAIGPTVAKTWRRATHDHAPDIRPSSTRAGGVRIEMPYKPAAPPWWDEHLKRRLREHGFGDFVMRSVGEHASVAVECSEDAAAESISAIHDAIEFANDQFEATELAAAQRAMEQRAADLGTAQNRRTQINDIALGQRPGAPPNAGIGGVPGQ